MRQGCALSYFSKMSFVNESICEMSYDTAHCTRKCKIHTKGSFTQMEMINSRIAQKYFTKKRKNAKIVLIWSAVTVFEIDVDVMVFLPLTGCTEYTIRIKMQLMRLPRKTIAGWFTEKYPQYRSFSKAVPPGVQKSKQDTATEGFQTMGKPQSLESFLFPQLSR